MNIFVKCNKCEYSIYTKRREVLTLLGDDTLSCSECDKQLDSVTIFMCSATKGNNCDGCQFRFQCFASCTVEDGLDK